MFICYRWEKEIEIKEKKPIVEFLSFAGEHTHTCEKERVIHKEQTAFLLVACGTFMSLGCLCQMMLYYHRAQPPCCPSNDINHTNKKAQNNMLD